MNQFENLSNTTIPRAQTYNYGTNKQNSRNNYKAYNNKNNNRQNNKNNRNKNFNESGTNNQTLQGSFNNTVKYPNPEGSEYIEQTLNVKNFSKTYNQYANFEISQNDQNKQNNQNRKTNNKRKNYNTGYRKASVNDSNSDLNNSDIINERLNKSLPRDSTSDSSFCERIPSIPTSYSLDNLGYSGIKYQNSCKMSNSHTSYTISSTTNGFVHTSETIQEQDDIFEPASFLPEIDYSLPVTFCHELESHYTSISNQIKPTQEAQDSQNKESPKSATTLSSSSSPDSRNLNEYETGDSQILVTASEGELSFGVETKVEKTIITQINEADSSSLIDTSIELSLLTTDLSSNNSSNNDSNYQEAKSGILKFGSYSEQTKKSIEFKQDVEEQNLISNKIETSLNTEKKELKFELESVTEIPSNFPEIIQEKGLKFVFPIEISENRKNSFKNQENNSPNKEINSLVSNIVLDVISTAVPFTATSLKIYENESQIKEEQKEDQIEKNEETMLEINSNINQSSPNCINGLSLNIKDDLIDVKFDDFAQCSPEQKDGIKSMDQNSKEVSFENFKTDFVHDLNDELSQEILIEPIDFENDCNNEICLNDDESVAYKKKSLENLNQNDLKSNLLNFEISVENDEISEVKNQDNIEGNFVKKESDSSASSVKLQSDNKPKSVEIDPAVDCFSCSIL